MRSTEKGQVTIPIEIRHKLDLRPGDEIEFVMAGDQPTVDLLAPV